MIFATLFSCGDAENTKDRKKDRIITIDKVDSTIDTLIMSDRGFSRDVDKSKKVYWEVGPNANISIVTIHKKSNVDGIFEKDPEGNATKFSAKVVKKHKDGLEFYEYYIKWKKNGSSTEYIYDPKISVKPTKGISEWIFGILASLGVVFLGIFAFRKKLIKIKQPKNLIS